MKNNNELENIFNTSKNLFMIIKSHKNFSYENISEIISAMNFTENKQDFIINNFNLNDISKLLKFYVDELNKSYFEDKDRFNTLFKCYILVIETITQLCILFSKDKEKIVLIDDIFQLLKESKNMAKLFIPLEEKNVKVINNYIGKQLYYYNHISHKSIKDKEIDYILQDTFMNIESMLHGYELCITTNFADCKFTNKYNENMVLKNNLSFTLLRMIYKLNYKYPNLNYFENNYFLKILEFYKNIVDKENSKRFNAINDFKNSLLRTFVSSANSLQKNTDTNMYEEKLNLLSHNTDEYKQLIDIILVSKNNSKN